MTCSFQVVEVDGSKPWSTTAPRDAAQRELLKETGQSGLSLVGPFHRREIDFLNHGEPQRQVEHPFTARTTDTTLSAHGRTELEHKAMTTWRWWSGEDISPEDEQIFPENLADLVVRASELGSPPDGQPVRVLVGQFRCRPRPFAVSGSCTGTLRVPNSDSTRRAGNAATARACAERTSGGSIRHAHWAHARASRGDH